MHFDPLTLKSGLEVLEAVNTFARRGRLDHRLNDQVCRALRALYFTPDGVLALLKDVEDSGAVPSDELRDRLAAFNDQEWEVGRALEAIDFKFLKDDLRLSLETITTLEYIRGNKMSLRHDIQKEINYYGQRGVKPDVKTIRTLIAGIEKLNAEIKETERLVNSRALER